MNGTDLQNALLITLIGMALVFLGVFILWILMDADVRITTWYTRRHPEEDDEAEQEMEGGPAIEAEISEPASAGLKQQAAAAAVTIAFALEEEQAALNEILQPAGYNNRPSAWQAVMRSAQLNQRSTQFTRKSRRSVR